MSEASDDLHEFITWYYSLPSGEQTNYVLARMAWLASARIAREACAREAERAISCAPSNNWYAWHEASQWIAGEIRLGGID